MQDHEFTDERERKTKKRFYLRQQIELYLKNTKYYLLN